MVRNDLLRCEVGTHELNLEHPIYQFLVRGRKDDPLGTAKRNSGGVAVALAEIKRLLAELPPKVDRRLLTLWEQAAVQGGKGGAAASLPLTACVNCPSG
jgi:hypothetical protein